MAVRKQQTYAKRARELEVKERRERKRARRAEAAAQRAARGGPVGSVVPDVDGYAETPAPEPGR